jgi:hypothetical protein
MNAMSVLLICFTLEDLYLQWILIKSNNYKEDVSKKCVRHRSTHFHFVRSLYILLSGNAFGLHLKVVGQIKLCFMSVQERRQIFHNGSD